VGFTRFNAAQGSILLPLDFGELPSDNEKFPKLGYEVTVTAEGYTKRN
jgi:hypothetical protein